MARPHESPTRSHFVWMSLTPILLYMGIFVLYPLVAAIYSSTWDFMSNQYVGLENYREALFEDRRVPQAFTHTFLYALIRIPPTIILGFFIALALNKILFARGVLIFGFFAPYVTSMVAYAALFVYVFSNVGLLNVTLQYLGLSTQPFIRDIHQALPSVALMDAFKHLGFDVLIFMAALQNIPSSLHEAARIDGATPWQVTRYVTIPLMAPTILFLVIVLTIWTIQVFEPVYVLTQGGPLRSTETVVYLVWDAAFENGRIGYASAISILLFAVAIAVSLIQLRLGRTRWEY